MGSLGKMVCSFGSSHIPLLEPHKPCTVKMETNEMEKVGSCAESPTLAIPNPVKVEKEKDLSRKMGSGSGTPAPTPAVQIKKEKETIPSGKAPLCSENPPAMDENPMEEPEAGTGPEKEKAKAKAKELQREEKKKNLLVAAYGSSTSKPLPPAAMKLLEELMLLAEQLDEKYEEMDILDISAMKGIHFDPPRWHRPGGYDRKPNPTDKDKK